VSTTIVYDVTSRPKVTITRDDDDGLTAIVEIDGLEPQRGTTAEERAVGITSLDPPTVFVRDRADRADVIRALVSGCIRAVSASATSTLDDDTGGPYGQVHTAIRVGGAVRAALRKFTDPVEDI
jgi:hypothetical protein